MDELEDLLREIYDDARFGIDILMEQAEMEKVREGFLMKPRDNAFERDPLIRTMVFENEAEASLADMSTESGVQYMKAMTLLKGILGD